MNEHGMVRAIHNHLKHPDIDIWKINDQYHGGVPDAVYFSAIETIWVEYKWIRSLPKRDTTLVNLCSAGSYLSSNQQAWLLRKHKMNNRVMVVVGCDEGIGVFQDTAWTNPKTRDAFLNGQKPKDFALFLQNILLGGNP